MKKHKRCVRCDRLVGEKEFNKNKKTGNFGIVCKACTRERQLQSRINTDIKALKEKERQANIQSDNVDMEGFVDDPKAIAECERDTVRYITKTPTLTRTRSYS